MKRFNEDIDMNVCFVTGRGGKLERHHIIGQAYRTKSTFYGFVVPLLPCIHPNGSRRSDKESKRITGKTPKQIDLELRQAAQTFYENELGKSREDWIREFGKNYL